MKGVDLRSATRSRRLYAYTRAIWGRERLTIYKRDGRVFEERIFAE
jgi:hypothetical protein